MTDDNVAAGFRSGAPRVGQAGRVVAVALGIIASLVGAPNVAEAATSVTLPVTQILAPGVPEGGGIDHNVVPVGARISMTFTNTQVAEVYAVMRVDTASERSMFVNEVRCFGPGESNVNHAVGQNVYGVGSGTPPREVVTLTTRFLIRPSAAGVVECQAYVRAGSLSHNDATFWLRQGWIEFSETGLRSTTTVASTLDAPGLPQASEPWANQSINPQVYRPWMDIVEFPVGTATVGAVGDAQLVVCYPFAGPCDKSGSNVVQVTLLLNQWKSDGTLCRQTSTSVLRTTPYWVHHVYYPLTISPVPVSTDAGCVNRFNTYLRITWSSGETVGLQGTATGLRDSRYSSSTHASDMSKVYLVAK